jgi:hypothetical protein
MRRLALSCVALLALSNGVQAAAPCASPAAAKESKNKIDQQADAKLKEMSTYLAGLKTFRVDTTAVDEVVLPSGEKIERVASSRIAVRRPNGLRSDRTGPRGDVELRYDGKQISVYGKKSGFYATAPAPGTLDETIDLARAKFGLDAPGADLLMSDPYKVLTEGATSGKYLGLETIDGTPCHHLAFRGKSVDFQIWIQDGDKPLPRRFVIVSKHERGEPQFSVAMSGWQPDASLSDALFVFQPPPGAKRIQFLAVKQMKQQQMKKRG